MSLLCLLACAPELLAPPVLDNPVHDFDHDGFAELDGDCDDAAPLVNPGAEELCNGLDDDCDGLSDEPDASDARTFWLDTDGDGFGTTAVPACSQPPTASILAGDCDDADPAINPGALEFCNTLDDDCDGEIDEEDATDCSVYYEDLDGDGYGTQIEACLCEATGDFSATSSGDCDDSTDSASPDAAEVCGNGQDDDCDGLSVNSCFTDTVSAADADLRLRAEEGGDRLGHAAALADLDGDGDLEVILGAVNHEGAEPQSGRAYVLEGPIHDKASGGVVDVEAAEWIWDGAGLNHRVGSSFAVLDSDDDGVSELVVGALGADDSGELAGAAYVVSWPPSGSGAMEDIADVTLLGRGAEDKLGGWVCGLGDVDGDGLDDLLVGAARATYDFDKEGAAYLVLGPLDQGGVADELSALVLTGESDSSALGSAMMPAGDLDADGLDDIVLGAYQFADTDNGAAYVISGTVRGTHRVGDVALVRLLGDAAGQRMGVGITGDVDVDGDGQVDLVVAASRNDEAGEEAGIVYVFHGPITAQLDLEEADSVLWGDRKNQRAGGLLLSAGDFDGAGPDELLVHAQNALYLVHTPLLEEDLVRETSTMIEGEDPVHSFGSSVALGDLTYDGVPDLLVGAESHPEQGMESGAAYIFYGSTW